MSGEGAAEKIYEAGIEVVNPGGLPDVLRMAAKGWHTMGEELDEAYTALGKQVQSTLGEHWRGDSAEAFRVHWTKIGEAVGETLPLFEQAAKGLEEAADNIEEINDEIHKIYIDIGVSIGASVLLSFVTVGFSAAAGAANAMRLATQAVDAASKLGRLLAMAARAFRILRIGAQTPKWRVLTVELGVQWAVGTATGVATNLATGEEPDVMGNAFNGVVGAFGGRFLAGNVASRLGGGAVANAVDGTTVGVLSSVAGDTVNNLLTGDRFDASQMALGAVAGGLTGGAGSAAVHRATAERTPSPGQGLAGDVVTNVPIGFGLGAGGNMSKSIDGDVNGDPNEDDPKDRTGAIADARQDASRDTKPLRERPDPRRHGVFG